jgi:cysteine desulfurase/selenocysteine lyase
MNIKKIRKDFPILDRKIHGKKLIYFDNAATTQKPKQVLDAIQTYYTKHNANIHRGVHTLSEEATEMYDKAHRKVGKFINAEHPFEEVIFLRNATEGMNLVMYAWASNLERGDEILCTVMEHHSNIVPWQLLKEKGVILKYVDIKENGTLDINDLKKKISNKTKLVTCVHASNVTGVINPIKEIGQIAHRHNALFFVDGAQSVPHMPVDVQEIGCDFLSFSGHKMLAPTGIGVLYGKRNLLNQMSPFMSGGDMIKEVTLKNTKFNELPWKFEAGTPNIGGGIALGVATDYLNEIGMDNIRKHEKKLVKYAIDQFVNIKDLEIFGPLDPSIRAGIITFNIKGVHPHDVAEILDSEYGIAVRSGHHCAQPLTERLGQYATTRASFYIYNTREEVDVLIEGIKKIKKVFGK